MSVAQRLGEQIDTQCTAQILGIGTALPEHSITQEEAAEFALSIGLTKRYEKALKVLYRQTGVQRRYSVLLQGKNLPLMERQSFFPDLSGMNGATSDWRLAPTTAVRMQAYREHAAPLAIHAAMKAIDDSGIVPSSITHLITVSCTGFAAPGIDWSLIQQLELPTSVQRTHVGFMGCHASLNAIRIASSICKAYPDARVLVAAVELCTIHQQYTDDPQQLVANALFGDGAAAFVMTGSGEAPHEECSDDIAPQNKAWNVVDNASIVFANTHNLMSWHVGDYGFEMTLSPRVPEVIADSLRSWVSHWLTQHRLSLSDVSHWIVHPGGPKILEAAQSALGISECELEASWRVLRRCGNMSSPTVLFILEEIARAATPGPAVVLGFGPGLVAEACLLMKL